MANLSQIYDWFMTGKKPTQAQFWASWGSFWNKEETIPQSAISNLTRVLNAKTENDQFNAHKVDIDAHADLFEGKQSLDQKGVAGGYVPLNEFSKIAYEFLSIVNNLTDGGTTSILSAEQGKILQTQIDGINLLLTSNDVNLDTVQEIVDAIKTVETSLSSILVNDLTTGGATKALTAEMGKILKGLVDALSTAKFDIANISQNVEIDKASTTKVASVKQLYDWAVSVFKSWFLAINTQAGITYTFGINDYKKRTVFTSANPVTATVPTNAGVAIPIGSKIEFTQQGDGVVTIGGVGITFVTNLSLAMVKGETRILTKIATDTWTVEGSQIVSSIEPTYNTFIGGMSGVITDINSLIPYIKVFGGGGAGYNSSNISQVVQNFKVEGGVVKFLAISDYSTGDYRGGQPGGACTFYHDLDGFVKSHEGGFFRGNTTVSSIIMPKLKRIEDFAFEYPTNLSEYNFDSVEYIGGGGNFMYSKITYLRFPKLQRCWSFEGCSLLPATIDKFSFPDFNEHIGENLFKFTPVTNVHFPNCETFTNSTFRSSGIQTVIAPKLKKIGTAVFMQTDNGVGSPRYFDFPLVEEVGDLAFYECRNVLFINIPKCKKLGASPTAYNQVFEGITADNGLVINVHYSLKTCNGGAPDPDLVYAIGRGATVNYINDLPQKFTDEIIPITPVFSDDTAATAGGVKTGQRYVTPSGSVRVKRTQNSVTSQVSQIYKNTSLTPIVTGTTDNVILKSILIPANTLKNGDFMFVQSRVVKDVVSTNAATFTINTNTTNSLVGAIKLNTVTVATGNLYIPLVKNYSIEDGKIYGSNKDISLAHDITNQNSAYSEALFNVNIDNYILIAVQLLDPLDSLKHLSTIVTIM